MNQAQPQKQGTLECYCCRRSKPIEAFREYPLLLCWVCKREIVKWLKKQRFKEQVASPAVKIAVSRLCPSCNKGSLKPRRRFCDDCVKGIKTEQKAKEYQHRKVSHKAKSINLPEIDYEPSEPLEGSGGSRDMDLPF